MPKDDTELIGMTEAIRTTGYSASSLYRWEVEGKLSPIRTPGGHRRYRRSDLDALLSGDAKAAS